MTGRVELAEVRCGGRNFLRPGDPVRVKPSRPGRHDGYVGTVKRITAGNTRRMAGDRAELVPSPIEVEVIGAPVNRPVVARSFYLDRLERVAPGTIPTHHHADAS